MNKGLSMILVLVFAAACVGLTSVMPLAELGLLNPIDKMPPEIKAWAESSGFISTAQSLHQSILGLVSGIQHDPNFQYYVYALFLGLAMTAAAIGINVIGREDSEEKTVLPVKK